jgi:hypothetical protein
MNITSTEEIEVKETTDAVEQGDFDEQDGDAASGDDRNIDEAESEADKDEGQPGEEAVLEYQDEGVQETEEEDQVEAKRNFGTVFYVFRSCSSLTPLP